MPRKKKDDKPEIFFEDADDSPSGSDRDSDRSASGTSDTTSRTDRSNSRSASSTSERHGYTGGLGSADSDSEGGNGQTLFDSGELESGDGSEISRARSRAGSGSGRRSRTRTNSGTGTAQAGTQPVDEVLPRDVSFYSLGGGRKGTKNQQLTIEFFKESWGLFFHGLSFAFKDREWLLPEEDAQELAERTQRWMAAGGAKRMAAVEKFIAQYQPIGSLAICLAAVVGPRLVHTKNLQRKNAANISPKNPPGTNGTGPAGSPTETVPPSVVPEGTTGRTSGNGLGQSNLGHRSIRGQDWNEVFGPDVS